LKAEAARVLMERLAPKALPVKTVLLVKIAS
jgi:hypothetical protein